MSCPISKKQLFIWDYNNMPDTITEEEVEKWITEKQGIVENFDNFHEALWCLRDLYHNKFRKGCLYTVCCENGVNLYRKGMHFADRLGWAVLTRVISNEGTRKEETNRFSNR